MSVIIPSRRHLITRTKMPLLVPGHTVNLADPLAQGLVSWWRVNRTGYGTQTLYDLLGKNPATLTNMGVHSETSGWTPTTRPGGDGEVRFDGSNDYVLSTGLNKAVLTSGPGGRLAIAGWATVLTGATLSTGILQLAAALTSTQPWILFQYTTTTTVRWFLEGNYRITVTMALDIPYFHHIAFDGVTTWTAYLNGVQVGTYTGTVGGLGATGTYLGNGYNGYAKMLTDDWMFYTSNPSPSALYQSSLTGHPTLLRRRVARYYSFATAAAGSIVTCEPSRAQYQAQTPRITVGVIATPAQAQSQTLAQYLTRSFAANPSQAQYQAQVIQITRGILESPSQAQYQAQTPVASIDGTVVTCTPGRSQYQAQTPVITLGVVATPSRALYQASTPVAAAAAILVSATAGQAQYQAQTPNLGRTAVCTPGQSQYQAQTPRITIGVTEQPSRAQYQATTPVINGATTVVVTQGQTQYQAQTSRLTLGVTEQPSRSQYQAQTPQVSIGLVAGTSRAQTQAQTPQVGRGVTEQPGRAQYQAQTPVVERPITATPSRSQYQAVVPNITMTVVAQPSRSQIQAGTPILGRTIIVSRGQGQYQAVTPLTSRTALVTPSQGQYRAQAPVAGTETMGEVNVTPSRAQYQATTPIAAIETPAVYYSKQADGVGLAIQTVHPAVDGGGIQTLHPAVRLRL